MEASVATSTVDDGDFLKGLITDTKRSQDISKRTESKSSRIQLWQQKKLSSKLFIDGDQYAADENSPIKESSFDTEIGQPMFTCLPGQD